jgi:glutathione S-transferase
MSRVLFDLAGADGRRIGDSWAIAEHLEAAYPERPSLFGGLGRSAPAMADAR